MARLRSYIEANAKGSWKDWVDAAYHDGVSLSATGFYKSVLCSAFSILGCSNSVLVDDGGQWNR